MEYRKIRGVPPNVCTAEQKIAYNLALRFYSIIKKSYDSATTGMAKQGIITKCSREIREYYRSWWECSPREYNISAIYDALMEGLEGYITGGRSILGSYEDIGRMFPANYLY